MVLLCLQAIKLEQRCCHGSLLGVGRPAVLFDDVAVYGNVLLQEAPAYLF